MLSHCLVILYTSNHLIILTHHPYAFFVKVISFIVNVRPQEVFKTIHYFSTWTHHTDPFLYCITLCVFEILYRFDHFDVLNFAGGCFFSPTPLSTCPLTKNYYVKKICVNCDRKESTSSSSSFS